MHVTSVKKTFPQKFSLIKHFSSSTLVENLIHVKFAKRHIAVEGNLRTHLLVHTSEKPYSCVISKKTFAVKSHLGSHLLVHTVEKLPSMRGVHKDICSPKRL